jgi:ubiquinone/menaquinone biosynthesis C-methylase UbiE
MMAPAWTPGSLLQLSGSYWQTFTLHAGVKLRVFSILSESPHTAQEVAVQAGAHSRAMADLLHALCALGLLTKDKDRFSLVDAARRYLVEGSDAYVGHMILHHHHLAGSWARLDEAIRSGAPLRTSASFEDPAQREAFLMGMYNNAMLQAPATVEAVDLAGRHRLLDLAGGPGTYAIHFCLKYPQLTAVVADLPTTRPFAERTIARFGLSQQIRFSNVDALKGEIDGPYDVVWISHLLHALGPEECRDVIAKAVRTLEPGGIILIHEFILNDTMDGPLFPALFSLNMLLGTAKGRSYTEGQLRAMLAEAGIGRIRRESYRGPTESGILSGIRDQV